MSREVSAFKVSELYSNEEVYHSLAVGNAGGVRVSIGPSSEVRHIVVFTSIPTARQLAENPYHDRLEGDILIYTGAGRAGNQSVSGANARLAQQQAEKFPIYAFIQMGNRRDRALGNKRWGFLGLLQYLRCYPEHQVDAQGKLRSVWVFEFRVHSSFSELPTGKAHSVMHDLFVNHEDESSTADLEVVEPSSVQHDSSQPDLSLLEPIRRRLLGYEPRQFEHVIHDMLEQSGFDQVEVTRYSQDGGIDINARPGPTAWPLRHLLIQLQAKRWLHTVGRKEVAELRGSLQPHASGCIVTTSHFSRAALIESTVPGKIPITAIDGIELANIIHTMKLGLR